MEQFIGVFIIVAFIVWVSGFVIYGIKTNGNNLAKTNYKTNKNSRNSKYSSQKRGQYDKQLEFDDSNFFASLMSFLAVRRLLKRSKSHQLKTIESNSVFTAQNRHNTVSKFVPKQQRNTRRHIKLPSVSAQDLTPPPVLPKTNRVASNIKSNTKSRTSHSRQYPGQYSEQFSAQSSSQSISAKSAISSLSKSAEIFKESADLTLAKAKMRNVGQLVADFNPKSQPSRLITRGKYSAEFSKAQKMIDQLDITLQQIQNSDPRKNFHADYARNARNASNVGVDRLNSYSNMTKYPQMAPARFNAIRKNNFELAHGELEKEVDLWINSTPKRIGSVL